MITILFALMSCNGKGGPDDTADDSDPGNVDSGTSEDSGVEVDPCEDPEAWSTSIDGRVSVELWIEDEDGEREAISFEDSYSGDFPFGGIWVTAYEEDENGDLVYLDETVIKYPSVDGDDYSLSVPAEACGSVRVFAILDQGADRVIGPDEPMGSYADELALHPETAGHTDIDISILAPGVDPNGGGGGGGGGGNGSSGGGGDGAVTVSGDILITTAWAAGEVAAYLFEIDGSGPYSWHIPGEPTSNGSGAEAGYSLGSSAWKGAMSLLGVWDDDDNWLFDPSDTWGAYITSVDVDGNPITIEDEDLTDHDIQIPLDDGDSPFSIVPFITISGQVAALDGSAFDELLEEGASVHVAALKYRPSTDITLSQVEEDAYDTQSYVWDELTGNTSVAFEVSAPANSIVYLWVYADNDDDGTLNEHAEPVASGGLNDAGKLPTGEEDSTGNELLLGLAGD